MVEKYNYTPYDTYVLYAVVQSEIRQRHMPTDQGCKEPSSMLQSSWSLKLSVSCHVSATSAPRQIHSKDMRSVRVNHTNRHLQLRFSVSTELGCAYRLA